IVAKIGRAELGGDPESVSNDEPYVRLKPKAQWTTARTKDDLVDAMRRRVEGFPGVQFNFSQVIQTRNDELISGINAQIAVKVYGEDQDTLRTLAQEIRSAISNVRGAQDLALEQLATFRLSSGDSVISRENALRRVVVTCNVTGRDIGGFVHDAQAVVAAQVETPPGYFITWGGQFENEQQAVRRLLIAIPVSL